METVQPKIAERSLVPPFDLPATRGGRAQLWAFKGLRHLVIFLLPHLRGERSTAILKVLARLYEEYSAHNAEVLVISKDNRETLEKVSAELKLPYPLASDVTGAVTEAYTLETPAVFVIDKYGELYDQAVVDLGTGPDHQRLLDSLHLIELECPECGVATWPSGSP